MIWRLITGGLCQFFWNGGQGQFSGGYFQFSSMSVDGFSWKLVAASVLEDSATQQQIEPVPLEEHLVLMVSSGLLIAIYFLFLAICFTKIRCSQGRTDVNHTTSAGTWKGWRRWSRSPWQTCNSYQQQQEYSAVQGLSWSDNLIQL